MSWRKQAPVLPQKPAVLLPKPAGDLYQAIYDFSDVSSNDYLTFLENDLFEVLEKPGNGWYLAKSVKTHQVGYIPANYVEQHKIVNVPKVYNLGALKRAETEKMLQSSKDGTFLFRISENRPDVDYTLSVKDGSAIEHYPVVKAENGDYFITRKTTFKTINDLADYYSAENSDGLCVKLDQLYVPKASNSSNIDNASKFGNTENDSDADNSYYTELDSEIGCSANISYTGSIGRIGKPGSSGFAGYAQSQTRQTNFSVESTRTEISPDQLKFLEMVGKGKCCAVFKGLWNNRIVAIKKLSSGAMPVEKFLVEANIMKRLKHAQILDLLGISSRAEPICLILEYCNGGSLQDYLKSELDSNLLIEIADQIANGMAYMELENCIHRNLAARNILVAANNAVKIADFGLAKFLGTKIQYLAEPGERYPIKWTAPEAVEQNFFSIKSDVWSYGIVLIELWTKAEMPYKDMKNLEVLPEIKNGYRLPQPKKCPKPIYSLMLECWHLNPVKRPNFTTIKRALEDYI